jgi:hypothetical protein
MIWKVNPLEGKTINWRAGCGKTASPVRREGEPNPIGSPYPYKYVFVYLPVIRAVDASRRVPSKYQTPFAACSNKPDGLRHRLEICVCKFAELFEPSTRVDG